jgi:competence protein ComEC
VATVEIIFPADRATLRHAARDNRSSCVLRISSAAGSVLLTGDLPSSADAQLVSEVGRVGAGAGLRSDVLVVPQQGSRNAASRQLLAAASPAYAVLQVGYRNRHRHPHPTVLQRLSATGADVLRTDHDGAVQIRLRAGKTAQVRRARRDAPPYWRIDAAAE